MSSCPFLLHLRQITNTVNKTGGKRGYEQAGTERPRFFIPLNHRTKPKAVPVTGSRSKNIVHKKSERTSNSSVFKLLRKSGALEKELEGVEK